MRRLAFVLSFVLGLFLPAVIQAQTTTAELETRLVGKPLYIRGLWADESLRFDSYGQLIGVSKRYSFTLCGANIKKVRLEASQLILEGERVGLKLAGAAPKRVDLQGLRIAIDRPADGDFSGALNAIFVDDVESLIPLLPSYWQLYAKVNFIPADRSGHLTSDVAFSDPSITKIDGDVKAPKILKSVEPLYTQAAHDLQYSSKTLVGLFVEETGIPSHLMVVRGAGLGLDEQALYAVSRYVFAPATENGKPIRVRLNIEVSFDAIR
jgi:hypothetical protein